MIYDLAKWCMRNAARCFGKLGRLGFFGFVFLAIPYAVIGGLFFALGVVGHAASFMTHLENFARWSFFGAKRLAFSNGIFGFVFFFPLFLVAMVLCVGVVALTIFQANPFRGST